MHFQMQINEIYCVFAKKKKGLFSGSKMIFHLLEFFFGNLRDSYLFASLCLNQGFEKYTIRACSNSPL